MYYPCRLIYVYVLLAPICGFFTKLNEFVTHLCCGVFETSLLFTVTSVHYIVSPNHAITVRINLWHVDLMQYFVFIS